MLGAAQKVIEKYEEIESELASPEVIAEQALYTKLQRQYKGLEKSCIKAREYIQLSQDLAEWKRVLAGDLFRMSRGEMPIRGAISLQELKDAYVVVMNLNEVVGKILEQFHVTNLPIVSSLKTFFSPSNGTVELWRQKCSTLLDVYVNKLEKNLDLSIAGKELTFSIGEIEDNIAVDLKLQLESERQCFWIDGLVKNSDVLNICSNKDFKLSKITFQIMPNHSLVPIVEKCKGENNEYRQCFNLYDFCKEDLFRMTQSINAGDFAIGVTVKTKQGGIVTVDGEVR